MLNVDVWMGFKEFLVGAGRRCCMSMEGRVPVVIMCYKSFGLKQYDGTMDISVSTNIVLGWIIWCNGICHMGQDTEECYVEDMTVSMAR
jgi:hypothetical protein